MKTNLSSLQLLALCQLVAASPCKPAGSSATTGLTTGHATTERSTTTALLTVSETPLPTPSSATEAETLTAESLTTSVPATTFEATTASTTETVLMESMATSGVASTSGAAPASEAIITSSETAFETETESITTSGDTTTSEMLLISTTSAEPTTTTSTTPEKPGGILINLSFEGDTISPWMLYGTDGSLSLSTSEARTGSKSAHLSIRMINSPSVGIGQAIDPSLLEANQIYEFSVYTKFTSEMTCSQRRVACTHGNQIVNSASFSLYGASWEPMSVYCRWSQDQLDAGPGVRIFMSCERIEWWVDDAALVEVAL